MRDLLLVNALVNQVTSLHDVHQAKDNRMTPGDRHVIYCHHQQDNGTVVYVQCDEDLGTTCSGSTVTVHRRDLLQVFYVPDEAVLSGDLQLIEQLKGAAEDEAMKNCPNYALRHRYIPSSERMASR